MASNAQKVPLARSYHQFIEGKQADFDQLLQKGLPCEVVSVQGSLVTVKWLLNYPPFTLTNMQIGKAQSKWNLEPTQVGDQGIAMPSPGFTGQVTGIGSGVADQYRRGNLTNLVFQPVTNKSVMPADPDTHYVIGPKGANMQTQDGTVTIAVTPTGINMTGPGGAVQMQAGKIYVSPEVGGNVYLGGDGVTGTFGAVLTEGNIPSTNVFARTA